MNLKNFLVPISICCLFCVGADNAIDQPIERIKVAPLQFNAQTGVTVEPYLRDGAGDCDFGYRWLHNGEEDMFETSPLFPGEKLKRGDRLTVEITPVSYDGTALAPAIIQDMEAVNASPEIVSSPPRKISGNRFVYQFHARDADGDNLTYSLAESPEGMAINPDTGLIIWEFSEGDAGETGVKAIVEDGHGGRAEQTFNLNLSYALKGSVE